MTTTAALPILTGTTQDEQGADAAPGVIVVHSCTTYGPRITLCLTGEIDHFSAAPVRVILAAAAAHGYTHLVLDTTRVTFCDSGLLRLLESWTHPGRVAHLLGHSGAVRRLLRATRPRQPSASCSRT